MPFVFPLRLIPQLFRLRNVLPQVMPDAFCVGKKKKKNVTSTHTSTSASAKVLEATINMPKGASDGH